MSDLQRVKQPQKLFKFAIDRHLKQDKNERLHFFRANRWRYNTFNRINILKKFKLKYPIMVGITFGIALDYTLGFYQNPDLHH